MSALAGRVALVTGSSRGIGAGIARLFGEQGAKVALHGRDTAALTAVKDAIERGGGRAIAVTAEATSSTEIDDLRRRVEAELGPIDILGTPEDVARAALFLASDAAGWISGTVLDVAGGSVLV